MIVPLEQGIECRIIDSNNEIRLVDKNGLELKEDSLEYKYISLLPLTQIVTGITLKGFKYPLKDATLKIGESLRCEQ